jgi:peptidoglycan/xylan/chitin deacetylase (PgdA/CDA1 family)
MTDHSRERRPDVLTIVGYHYVRPIAGSRFPAIKGREVVDFRGQLRYFQRHYHFVSIEEVVASATAGEPLPPRPLLLTFDDGYSDHFLNVFPILQELGVRGAFYPTTVSAMDRRVLDANKIHFILAAVAEPAVLIDAIESAIAAAAGDPGLRPVAAYRERLWIDNRFDPAPVLYCKQLLQHGLPDPFRRRLVDTLFRRFVTEDEAAFAAELYVGVEDLRRMHEAGMHIGGHGGRHAWLDHLSVDEQRQEIADSCRLLEAVRGTTGGSCLTFCYPYGGYNGDTLALLRERRCELGLTVRPDLARVEADLMLELPRLDTTDFPTDADQPANHWTLRARTANGVGLPVTT